MTSQWNRPLAGFAVGVALAIAASAVAQDSVMPETASTASAVVIKDRSSKTEASVDSTGRLLTERAPPSSLFNETTFDITSTCVQILAAPTNRTVIVTDIGVDVWQAPTSPGAGESVAIYNSANCTGGAVGDVNPSTVGLTTITFGPGLATTALSAVTGNGMAGETYVHGYTVPSSEAPPSAVIASPHLHNIPGRKG